MAPNVTLHFYPANDLNGDILHEITDEDPFFRSLKLQIDRDGLGGAQLELARRIGFAGFGSGTFNPEVFVRILISAYSDTEYYPWGFFLNKRDQTVIHVDEDGGEVFTFGGAGPKQYLSRGILGIGSPSTGWNLDLINGVWRWGDSATVGRILDRIINQDSTEDDPALPDLTDTFDSTDDSLSVAWADTDLGSGDDPYTIPIGTSLLDALWDLGDVVDLTSWIELGTVASPKFELNVAQGDSLNDYTGSAFGTDVCLLKEGVNITNDALTLTGRSLRKATHVVVEGLDGKWAEAVKPGFSSGEYVKRVKIEYARTRSLYWLEKAGIRWLKRQDAGEKALAIEILPGASDATGLYFPAPDRVLWLSNLVSVDTSADGMTHSPLDIQPSEDQLVTGIELELQTASDDTDATAKARSWSVTAHLNTDRPGTNPGSPSQSSASGGGGQDCKCGNGGHPHHPPPCIEPDPGGVGDPVAGANLFCPAPSGVTSDCGPVAGSEVCGKGQSAASTVYGTITPGTYYSEIQLTTKYGGGSHVYTFYADIRDSSSVLPDTPLLLDSGLLVSCRDGGDWTTFSGTFEIPTGYDRVRFRLGTGTLHVLEGSHLFNEYTPPGDPVENDPDCVPVNQDSDSPYYARSDDPRFTADDQHLTTLIRERVVNNSGGDLLQGAVVVSDPTFDGQGVTTTTTAALTDAMVGVLEEDIAEDGQGIVIWSGVTGLVNVTGTAADGDYLFTSTTPGEADTDATRAEGAFGRVIRDASGAPFYTLLWGVPDMAGGGGSYTDEEAQDAVGTILADTSTVNLTYTDATPEIKADVIPGGIEILDLSTTETDDDLRLRPDGAGGVEWGTAPAGGAGSGNVLANPSTGSVHIPGLGAHPGLSGLGGGGITEEYDSTTHGITWTPSNPTTTNSNTTIPSHLFVQHSGDTTERRGYRTWQPGNGVALDARVHISMGIANTGTTSQGLLITNSADDTRVLLQRQTGAVIQAFTFAGGTYTQRGSNHSLTNSSPAHLRITRDTGTNWTFWYSENGYQWIFIFTQSHSFTVDKIGYRFVSTTNTGYDMGSDYLRTNV